MAMPWLAARRSLLRWRAPHAPAPWTGTRDATRPGNRCPQSFIDGQASSTTEDCLFLNVWIPVPTASRLPVMVWIHGDGFTTGSGSDYDAGLLVRKGHVVVVTVNYRLGPLGFLDLPVGVWRPLQPVALAGPG